MGAFAQRSLPNPVQLVLIDPPLGMAELLMKSAIAPLMWKCFDHDQLRRPNHLNPG